MNVLVSLKEADSLIAATYGTALRIVASETVGRRFKSVHYKSSRLICDCVCLNILLNRNGITPDSADKILTYVRKTNKAFYSNTESAYKSIRDEFDMYARGVLQANYAETISLDMRITNFIVYVISLDISRRYEFNFDEIFMKAYSYSNLMGALTD